MGKTLAEMVDHFLAWPLPESVCSDQCATQRGYPGRTGTSLLTADEARQMLEHVTQVSAPSEIAPSGDGRVMYDYKGRMWRLVKDAAPQASPSVAPADSESGSAVGPAVAAPSAPSATVELREAREIAQKYEDRYFGLLAMAKALLDRDITYLGEKACLRFESHDQAMNHISEARRTANV